MVRTHVAIERMLLMSTPSPCAHIPLISMTHRRAALAVRVPPQVTASRFNSTLLRQGLKTPKYVTFAGFGSARAAWCACRALVVLPGRAGAVQAAGSEPPCVALRVPLPGGGSRACPEWSIALSLPGCRVCMAPCRVMYMLQGFSHMP